MTDYSSLFEVRLATYDDIPSILDITHEAFVKYAELAGLEHIAALDETYEDVKKDIEKLKSSINVRYQELNSEGKRRKSEKMKGKMHELC